MKAFTVIGGLVAVFISSAPVFAAVTTVKEYPDRYVVEIDGSMDKKIAPDAESQTVRPARTPAVAAVQTPVRSVPAQASDDDSAPAKENSLVPKPYDRAMQIRAYMSQLPPSRSQAGIEGRLAGRQARWRKLRAADSQ